MSSPFLSYLKNPKSWFSSSRCETKLDLQTMENYLFKRPCTQIDFSALNSIQHIKDILLECCLRKGECLNYNSNPFLSLPDYSKHMAEWHYDGISSVDSQRVPDSQYSSENGFSIANCHLLYCHLSQRSKDLLSNIYQVILGHKLGNADLQSFEKVDLYVKMLEHIASDVFVLRAHIPFRSTVSVDPQGPHFYCYPDDLSFYFKEIAWSDQQYLLSDIQAALLIPCVTYNHSFGCNSLLAVHNKSCFHSAREVQGGSLRSVFRLQLIEAP